MTPRRGPPCFLLRLLPSGCLSSLAPNEVKEGRGEVGGGKGGEGREGEGCSLLLRATLAQASSSVFNPDVNYTAKPLHRPAGFCSTPRRAKPPSGTSGAF